MKKVYLMRLFKSVPLVLFLFASIVAWAQQGTVSGTIKDGTGLALPGVSVIKKGTTIGTSSDASGNFSIEASGDDILVISFIGYTTEEVTVGTKSRIDVLLAEDIAILQEIVVTGYGEMRRSDLSTAQISISADQIEKTINTTLDQALQGRAAGVYITQNTGQPGGGVSVNIRGINSISGSNEPLYVIDGIQIQQNNNVTYGTTSSTNALAGLNPADIESLEILQGPSATAIYGSRGTNGVVLVTTKRGKSGETKINYSFLYSAQDKPKQLPVLDLPKYAEMYSAIRVLENGLPPTQFLNPSLLGPGTNWQSELFKTAPLAKHQLSLSGGNEKTRFYLSGEYFDQAGIAIGSDFKRGSIRLNLDNEIRKWLKLGVNLSVNQTTEKVASTQQDVINTALSLAPDIPVKNPNGSWGGADPSNGNDTQLTPLNPIAIASINRNELKRGGFLGGTNLEINLFKGLIFRTSLNVNAGFKRQEDFAPTYRIGNRVSDNATLNVTAGLNSYWNWNQLLQYNTNISKHDLGIMVSHEAQESSWKDVGGEKVGFITNDIPDLNIGNDLGSRTRGGQGQWAMESYFSRFNYNFDEKYYLQAAIRADGSVNFGPNNKWGSFPSVSAAWRLSQEPFMQSVPAINELKLRIETGITGSQGNVSYYGPLNTAAGPWGAGFYMGRYGNDNLKWEETKTNNIGLNVSFLDNRIQFEADYYTKKTDNLLLTAPLPDYLGTNGEGRIEPPTINIGSLENKGWGISLNTINYDRGDITWNSNFNISGFKTKVLEFYSQNAFVDRTPTFIGDNVTGNSWTQRSSVGYAPWLFRGYLFDGLYQNVDDVTNSPRPTDNSGQKLPVGPNDVWVGDVKFKDISGPDGVPDGVIDERDKTTIGNPWPKFTLGFTNTLNYKGFELSVLLTGAFGNDVFNFLRFSNTNPNNISLGRNMLAETFNYARLEGEGTEVYVANPETEIPRLARNRVNGNRIRITDQFVEDGSYVRVKNIQLSYSLPKSVLSKQNVVRGLRLTVAAQNIATFTKYKGYDPEVGAYVGANVSEGNQPVGLDYGRYPLTPVYSFSVGVDF